MKIHLPARSGPIRPRCGVMGPDDEIITHVDQAEAVTCPVCARIVITFTVSDRPKVGC